MYVKPHKNTEKKVTYIVLELAPGGELFYFLKDTGRFSESLARYFFTQLMEGLQYCFIEGISHRDLKPDNLLLDAHFNIKIADFGFAGPISGKDGEGNLTSYRGTFNYMAPEIHLKKPYKGHSVDIFSAGVILFMMVYARQPFEAANPKDTFYTALAQNRADLFWKAHQRINQHVTPTEEFKQLVQAMLQLNPMDRPTIPEIMGHPWMKGEVPTHQAFYEECKQREDNLKQRRAEEQK